MKRDFNNWFDTMTDSVATWDYYTDFSKVYQNVDDIKVELNILNSLIGSKNIEDEFTNLAIKYPSILNAIPILLAKREHTILIEDSSSSYAFNFKKRNYEISEYAKFMDKTGLFDLLQNHLISNLYDYVTGIEVGLDSNARKNRTGHAMEDIVESYIAKEGFVKDVNYFKEMKKSTIENKWGINLDNISNNGKTEKRFDFVIKTKDTIYAFEVNYYGSNGSKLNETARSYKNLAIEAKEIKNFRFIWITDGKGWSGAKHNLEETFDIQENLYNINDLKHDILSKIII